MMPTTVDHSPAPRTARPTRHSGLRVLCQFSLRTLLTVMTLASIGCWWYLQPDVVEEELAGKHLKLRRQVRDRVAIEDSAPNVGESADREPISDGYWRLVGQDGELLVEGNYHRDQPQGKWTLHNANGQKAAEGQVLRGARTAPGGCGTSRECCRVK